MKKGNKCDNKKCLGKLAVIGVFSLIACAVAGYIQYMNELDMLEDDYDDWDEDFYDDDDDLYDEDDD